MVVGARVVAGAPVVVGAGIVVAMVVVATVKADGCKKSIRMLMGATKSSACDNTGRKARDEFGQLLAVITMIL